LGAVGLLLVLFAIIPQLKEAYGVYQQIGEEKPKLEKLLAKKLELENLVYTPEYAQISRVNAALPSKKPLLELLSGLNAISSQTGVSIDSFDLSPGLIASESAETQVAATAAYDKLALNLKLTGTFESIQEFMVQLERISPFTTITLLDLSDPTLALDGTKFQSAELETETYYFTQPIRVTIDSPLPKLSAVDQKTLIDLEQFSVTDLPIQTEIRGGGLDDLFGVKGLF
jgi:Tfp pilus assembly protein PilO